jgi:hypothetical protein
MPRPKTVRRRQQCAKLKAKRRWWGYERWKEQSVWERKAWSKWPRAIWIDSENGGGPFATVYPDPRGTTVVLFPTLEEAERAKERVCGGQCWGKQSHYVWDVRKRLTRNKRDLHELIRGEA